MRDCGGAVNLRDFTNAELRTELLRRYQHPNAIRLQTPEQIAKHMQPLYLGLEREEFHVLCLDSRHYLLRQARVSIGSVDQCYVDPREVFRPALTCRATGIVLLHNHPSGDPEPSAQDVALTRQLRDAGKTLCLRVLDHIVVGSQLRGASTELPHVSLLARGLFEYSRPYAAEGRP